ncbi:hypothetical protein QR680_016365 [Steinernema hermaphroditum]|uniref:Uncharacterized protein n=1 Tax=Steinernema hermaphroditum TaxID=289476 RepID=A0AA39HBZ6_9BILA|nr:hypothetical protein QR680_016365 [Steinernema hermaphroditum]
MSRSDGNNLIAKAFISQDGMDFYRRLFIDDQNKINCNKDLYLNLIQSGLGADLNDFINTTRTKCPPLYKKLIEYRQLMEESEKELPAKVRAFIHNRRRDVKSWFPCGHFDDAAFVDTFKRTGRDVAAMQAHEKRALYAYYPHMKRLING